jgi:hypothetical protein
MDPHSEIESIAKVAASIESMSKKYTLNSA